MALSLFVESTTVGVCWRALEYLGENLFRDFPPLFSLSRTPEKIVKASVHTLNLYAKLFFSVSVSGFSLLSYLHLQHGKRLREGLERGVEPFLPLYASAIYLNTVSRLLSKLI